MTHRLVRSVRWTSTLLALCAALLLCSRQARADAYWVYTYLSTSNSGCQYDQSRHYLLALGGDVNDYSNATTTGTTSYAFIGGSAPTRVSAQLVYFNGSGHVNNVVGNTGPASSCLAVTLRPAYNSNGVSCGSASQVTATSCIADNP